MIRKPPFFPSLLAVTGGLLLAGCSSPSSPPSAAPSAALLMAPSVESVFFSDHFEGTALDDSRWDLSLLTGGVRYCMTNPPDGYGPGVWQDVATTPYAGVTLAPPYGSVTVSGSVVSLQSGPIAASPYFWAGPPSRPSPVPAEGDFTLEFRMRFDHYDVNGGYVTVLDWPDSTPAGTNSPGGVDGTPLFVVMGGYREPFNQRPLVSLAGQRNVAIAIEGFDPLAWHVYRLELRDGSYTAFVDGHPVIGPVASSARPSAVCIWGPSFTWWRPYYDWTDFSLDYFRVTRLLPADAAFAIDVKPGDEEAAAPINLKAQGTVPVALLGSAGFDVSAVDLSTLVLSGAPLAVKPNGSWLAAVEDVNGDGFPDLVAHFPYEQLALAPDATEVVLTGLTASGDPFTTSHPIRIVP